MPGLPAGAIVQMKITGSIFQQITQNSFWYNVTTAGTAATVADDLNQFLTKINIDVNAVLQKFMLCVSSSWLPDSMYAQEISPVRSVAQYQDISALMQGRGAATASNLAAVITKSTALAGRSQIGSVHIPGIATADMANGSIVPGLVAALDALGTAMLAQVIPGGSGTIFTPVIPHVAKPATATTGTTLTSTETRNTVRVMRRRTIGVGQ